MPTRYFVILVTVLAGIVSAAERPELALGRTVLHDYDPPLPGSYELPALSPAADGQVIDTEGGPRTLKELFTGKITVMSFIYTRCSDPRACPAATRALYLLHQVSEQDPVIAQNLHLVTLSFDPTHDTPKVMKSFQDRYHPEKPGAPWTHLTTRSESQVRPILEAYGQAVDRKKNPNDGFGPFFHQLRVYLIDRTGVIRNIYSYDLLDPRLVVTDVRTLLMEEKARLAKAQNQ